MKKTYKKNLKKIIKIKKLQCLLYDAVFDIVTG